MTDKELLQWQQFHGTAIELYYCVQLTMVDPDDEEAKKHLIEAFNNMNPNCPCCFPEEYDVSELSETKEE